MPKTSVAECLFTKFKVNLQFSLTFFYPIIHVVNIEFEIEGNRGI